MLILNADDWGRNPETTDRITDCVAHGAVSSVSAMVFMQDSERSATIALEKGIEAGVHLNFTTPFSAPNCSRTLIDHQQRLAHHLLRHRFAPLLFHPGLSRSFEYVTAAQLDEFRRLYGADPVKLDGHHHMHLCANVIFQRLLPKGTLVRRNFSFEPGEKSLWNRAYRQFVDRKLSRNHNLVDYFFSLAPINSRNRLQKIFSLATHAVVEVETHPVQPDEYQFLTGGEIFRHIGNARIVPASVISTSCLRAQS